MANYIGTGTAAPGDVWTNGKIGAGHGSPAYPIDSLGRCFIRGSGGGGGGFWASDSDDSGNAFSFIGRGNDTENHVGFYSNNNWRMVIKDSGNVGFGLTNPQTSVHINAVLRLEPQSIQPPGGKGDLYVNSNGELNFHNGICWKKVMTV